MDEAVFNATGGLNTAMGLQ